MENKKHKICAVICEFNPFHNGHDYLIGKIKQTLPDHRLVAIMSGDFVQRAEPAIFDKYYRAKEAIEHGFSAVIQLPTVFSVAGAQIFAEGSIKTAVAANADYLAFGCETEDFALLQEIANVQSFTSPTFNAELKANLDNGLPYASSLVNATVAATNNPNVKQILACPNNILAVEYMKAIIKYNSNIIPMGFKRIGSEYNDIFISSNYPSASALRSSLIQGKDVSDFLPNDIPKIVDYPLFDNLMTAALKLSSLNKIKSAPDCAEGLEYKIKKASLAYCSLNDIINAVKTKRYTYARIKRIALQVLLDITSDTIRGNSPDNLLLLDYPARVLGFNSSDDILPLLKKPIYIKNSELKNLKSPSTDVDINAALVATMLHHTPTNPLKRKPVII